MLLERVRVAENGWHENYAVACLYRACNLLLGLLAEGVLLRGVGEEAYGFPTELDELVAGELFRSLQSMFDHCASWNELFK